MNEQWDGHWTDKGHPVGDANAKYWGVDFDEVKDVMPLDGRLQGDPKPENPDRVAFTGDPYTDPLNIADFNAVLTRVQARLIDMADCDGQLQVTMKGMAERLGVPKEELIPVLRTLRGLRRVVIVRHAIDRHGAIYFIKSLV